MNWSSSLLRLIVAVFAALASMAVAQTPSTLGIQLDGGHVGITITGEVGRIYHIESTTNLSSPADWIPIGYLKLPASPHLYVDTRALASVCRFYRTRAGDGVVLPVPDMAYVPAGTFIMGSPESEAQRFYAEGQHSVTLTRSFWMGKYEVTQGEYLDVMGKNPSYFRNGTAPQTFSGVAGNGGTVTNESRHPVEQVNLKNAMDYCVKLTQREFAAGRIYGPWQYRLPTQAEWEYACRAGTTTAFHHGAALRQGMDNFNFGQEYESKEGTVLTDKVLLGRTSEVGSYAPNAFGLYDMHGNVSEWCQDWEVGLISEPVTDPVYRFGFGRVIRGGAYFFPGYICRSAAHRCSFAEFTQPGLGFRVILSPYAAL